MSQDFSDQLNEYEEKWQRKWQEEEIFEPDPSNDEKFFITVAYPYPSGGMHLGHVRTFTLPDVFARFKRMQGFNVLFPMAWHVTGTPIIGALDRLKEGEEEQLHVLRDVYNVPEEDLESFKEPMDFANYFIENSYKPNMNNLGFSVDWRREFTTNDNQYNKFIEWQYKRLRDQGLVEKGMHPTKYDLKSENPVTTHDLLEGEDAERQEYSLVKFENQDYIFPMATLRPETVYGVTHTLIHPDIKYGVYEIDNEEEWILTEEAATKIKHQGKEVIKIGERQGADLVGETVRNPVTGENVLLLPATFIDPDSGTGIVMSVPAHAPYDWISLQDLKENKNMLREYGVNPEDVENITPKHIINVEGYEDIPAREACNSHGVESQEDEEALEEATEEVYEKEFHTGRLNASCGEFAGEKVNAIKDRLAEKFEKDGHFDSMYDFSEEVISRSGGKVIVSLQESWFLNYEDKGWKDKVNQNLDQMNIIPEEKRDDYRHTIDWLESWPCIRNYGLGTKMPFDEDFIIEPLSDSTIYMSFYTIKHIIDEVDPKKLRPEFFDYVFQDEGTGEEVAEITNIEKGTIEDAKESFDYWYPLDWRTSGQDLVQNHLTFMMFHHTALFDEENWPQGIATWGMGTLEGKKMSSSKGHVVLPDKAIQDYGADTVRFFLFASAEPWQDFDWRAEEVQKYKNKLKGFDNRVRELYGSGEVRDKTMLDRYAESKLQKIIKETTKGLEEFQTRKAGLNAFFELNNLINNYNKRTDELNQKVINDILEAQVKLMSPFTPHLCEELWNFMDKKGLASQAEWPEHKEYLRDKEVEQAYQIVENTVSDIRELDEIVDEYNEIKIIVAEDWKRDVFEDLYDIIDERPEFGEAMSRLVKGRKDYADQIKSFLQDYLDSPGELPPIMAEKDEKDVLEENEKYISSEFNADVVIELEKFSDEEKASRAEPGRPAIVLK